VAAIEKADNIIVYCVGTSLIAAESARMRFYRVGEGMLIYNDPANQAVSSSLIGKNDLAIGISASGKTKPTVNSLKIAKSRGATTICVTSTKNSAITKHSDIKLITATKESSFFAESFVSRVVQLVVCDILYACFAVKNYDRSIGACRKVVWRY